MNGWEKKTIFRCVYVGKNRMLKQKLISILVRAEFCRMYAYIFHTTVNMIMADSAASARSQCRAIAAYLREFDFCIQEIESTFRFLKTYTTLARFMPALLARKISALLSC